MGTPTGITWLFRPAYPPDELVRAGIPRLAATVLAARGYDVAAARAFLAEDREWWRRWLRFEPELVRAGEIILEAAGNQDGILVCGDYDTDGLCATALLKVFLEEELSARRVYHHIPTRADGYGFRGAAVRKAEELGCALIITVDCGTNHHETCALAGQADIRVVVTDHHLPQRGRPPAWAVFNPRLAEPEAPDPPCGTGAAYLLARAVGLLGGRSTLLWNDYYLILGAVATVADVVPLTGGNRALVKEGLRRWPAGCSAWPGLRILAEKAGIGRLDSEAVAYYLAPRLNAAGRLDNPEDALELLLTREPERGEELAGRLNRLNQVRQEMVARGLEEIARQPGVLAGRVIVAGTQEPPGLAGLLAGRLAEEHGCPAIVVNVETGRGSGRAPRGYRLIDLLAQTAELLTSYGGHEQACGLCLDPSLLDTLRERLNDLAPDWSPPPRLADGLLDPARCGVEEISTLDRLLEPYGAGNPRPVFLLPRVTPQGVRALGTNNEHTCFYADGLRVVWFHQQPQGVVGRVLTNLPVRLEVNDYFDPPVAQAVVV